MFKSIKRLFVLFYGILRGKLDFGNIVIDINNNRVIFREDFHIIGEKNIRFYTDQHLLLNSSERPVDGKDGYFYSIWFNSPVGSDGNPLKKEEFELLKLTEINSMRIEEMIENNKGDLLWQDQT